MIPADKNRCQTEIPNGANAFTIGGVPDTIRCSNTPTVIATETRTGEDGLKGSMSMCADCLAVAIRELPVGFFNIEQISNLPKTSTFIERIAEEKRELDEKRQKLQDFIDSDAFLKIANIQRDLLTKQIATMDNYSSILGDRLADLNK